MSITLILRETIFTENNHDDIERDCMILRALNDLVTSMMSRKIFRWSDAVRFSELLQSDEMKINFLHGVRAAMPRYSALTYSLYSDNSWIEE